MDKLVYLYYPLVLLILLWGSKWYGRGKWNGEFFSLNQSKMWQGFFAVCILLHHTGQKTCAPWLQKRYIIPGLDFFVPIGYFFVAVFLVCSGYGLYHSFRSKPDYLRGFVRKRVLPLVVTFYVTEWIFLAARLLMGEKLSAQKIFYYVTGLQQANPNAWFVMALPIFYMAFYLCFRFIRREGWALSGVWVLILGWVLIGCATDHNDWWMRGEWWYNTAFFFPLGLMFGKYAERIVACVKKHYILWMALAVAFGVGMYYYAEYAQSHFSYYCEWVPQLGNRIFRRFMCVLVQTGAAAGFTFFVVMLGLKVRIGNGVLRFMSTVTLEFYLIHALFVDLFGFNFFDVRPSLYYIKNVFLYVLAVAGCSLPATLLLRKVLHPRSPLWPLSRKN